MIVLAPVESAVPKAGCPEAALAEVVGAIFAAEAVRVHLLRDQEAGSGGDLVDARCRDYMIQITCVAIRRALLRLRLKGMRSRLVEADRI